MGSLTPIFSHFCFSFHSKSQFIVVMPPVCNKRCLALSLFYLPFASNISLHAVQMGNGQKSPHGKCSLRSSETEQHTIAASRISLCISNITAHGLLSEISVRTFNTGFACCVSTIVFSSENVHGATDNAERPVKEHTITFVNKFTKNLDQTIVRFCSFHFFRCMDELQNGDENEGRDGLRKRKRRKNRFFSFRNPVVDLLFAFEDSVPRHISRMQLLFFSV